MALSQRYFSLASTSVKDIVCLNVKELLTQSRHHIWSLSDCNGIRTHNLLICKQTLNHSAKLVKWLSCVVGLVCAVHLTLCYHYYFITVWNLKSTITYKCGRVLLSHTSVYFAISKLLSYSFHVPCIILSNVCFYIVRSDHSRKQVLLIKWIIFFWSSKIFFALFNFLEMVIYRTLFRHWSTLWNSSFKITTLIWLNLMLLNVVNFNVHIHSIVSKLIWYFPMSWKHITLTKTTLR